MPFDPLTWLVGFSFNQIGKKALAAFAKTNLSSLLRQDINAWAKALPADLDLVPEALFPKPTAADIEENRPALAELGSYFEKQRVPTNETWSAALFEQWEAVCRDKKEGPQEFFRLEPEKAREHLRPLAGALAKRCAQDENFFRTTVIEELRTKKLPDGAQTLESYWKGLRSIAEYPLAPIVFTASREAEIEAISKWLSEPSGSLFMRTSGVSDGLDFLAGLSNSEGHERLQNALIVYTAEAWRELAGRSETLGLIATPSLQLQASDISAAVESGHYVFLSGPRANLASGPGETLRRQDYYSIKDGLVESGFSESKAFSHARACCGSSSILKRLIARHPETAFPQWAQDDVCPTLAPFALVGGWRHVHPSRTARDISLPQIGSDPPIDVLFVSELVGLDENEIEKIVQRWQGGPEPLFIRFGHTVFVASREDTWHLLGGTLSHDQLKRFADLTILVLEEDNPAFQLAADQRWMANIYGKTHSLSQELRRSLVESLALMAIYRRAEPKAISDFELKETVQSVLEKVLPKNATWQRWASFDNNLTILAEADPEFFLSRVESDLGSDEPALPKLFQDNTHSAFGGAIHSHLLWALETLAWSSEFLPRVCVCLAQLAARDPGGTYANRPANSLREIFRLWLWHTNASLDDRVKALSAVLATQPAIGWKLLTDLLPSGISEFSHTTHMPRWRPWADGWSRGKLRPQIPEYRTAIAKLVIEVAGVDAQRWSQALDGMLRMHPNITTKVFEALENTCRSLDSSNSTASFALWDALRRLVSRHERYSDADWAFGKSIRDRLTKIRDRLQPTDSVLKHRWLFDHQAELPEVDVRKDIAAHDNALREKRISAIHEIIRDTGAEGITRLLAMGAHGGIIGWAVGTNNLMDPAEIDLPKYLNSPDHQQLAFAQAFIASRYNLQELKFVNEMTFEDWSSKQIANFSLCLPFRPEVWRWVETLSSEIPEEYWKNVRPISQLESLDDVRTAVTNLKGVGRGFGAIDVIHTALHDKHDLPSQLIAEVLEFAVGPQNCEAPRDIHYPVQQLVKKLQHDEELDQIRLARIEWGFLSILDPDFGEVGPDTLIKAIESQPAFYVDLLEKVFRGENEHPDDDLMTEQEQLIARNSRKLLDSLSRIPGTQEDHTVNTDYFRSWVEKVRLLAAECHRRKMCDYSLGELIARASQKKQDDWPPPALAKVMEELGSEQLFRGFVTGVLNSRGVTSRLPTDGGKLERNLMSRYEHLAKYYRIASPKLADAFLQLARHYEAEAQHEDEEAHRVRLGR